MKKIISLLLALILISTFCASAFATDDEPIELKFTNHEDVRIDDGKSYIIRESTSMNSLEIIDGMLTIAQGATVNINAKLSGEESAQINVFGTFYVSGAFTFNGTFNVYNFFITDSDLIRSNPKFNVFCDGRIESVYSRIWNVTNLGHDFHDGVCSICGYICENPFHSDTCPDCGMTDSSTATGSTLSDGNMTIIFTIAALVIGLCGGFVLGRKKKPTPANVVGNDEE